MANRVVIVGAGYAGIEAALKLYKKGKKDDIDITIIDRNSYHTLLTELHEVAGNRVSEDAVKVPLADVFKNTNINVVLDNIEKYDFEGKRVASATHEYPYDYLIVAIGSTPNYFGIPGLEENGFPLWSAEDAIRIRDHIERCFFKAATETDAERRRRLLTFMVGGAGFTGVEMIGELGQWVKKLCRQHKIPRSEVRLILVDMLDCVLSNLCDQNSRKAHEYMEKKLGIEIILSTAVKKVTEDSVDLGDGTTIGTHTLIWAAGVRASNDVECISVDKGSARRLCVDEYCRTEYGNVYAIGDVGALLDEKGKPYPAMVETALQTAEGAVHNILASMRGEELKPVTVKLHGVMVCIGNYFAVADLMGVKPGRWISLIMKYLVNMHYLNGILGIKGVWHYLQDEILRRRQHKRFLQRNYTKTVQAWWLVPLRLFLGWTWFYEGLKKILEGWMTSPKLATFLGYADAASGATGAADAAATATGAAADAVAAATGVVADTAAKLINIDWGWLGVFLDKAETGTMTFRIKFFLVDWIVKGWVLATDGWAMFFQVFIVILELLVGLAIFSGLFTFAASVASLALIAMFVTTTGMYDTTWWMLFAGIAIAAGAGRAFGLDHWVLPYFGRVWDATKKKGRLTLIFRDNRLPKIK
jgi:NADH dehydrogenase